MSENDVQISYAAGFEALLGVLAGARRPGSWFAQGAMETPMPALEIEGAGLLSFPVPEAQARLVIRQAAERAPYGKGDQTLVDESVRKVWQIAQAKVKIGGKGWATTFQSLVGKIDEELGCEGAGVEAQFYKLLVYEKGGFFLAHRDSEKAEGMFGTLVVALPSAHEGGELVLRHAGREKTIDLHDAAPSEIRYAAFYADCEHEVRPLRAGYRVCLIYNLVQKKKKSLAPPDQRGAIAEAAKLLAPWAASEEPPEKIVHLLEHHYTQAALGFSALKGADAALAQVLVPAAEQAGCAAYLALVHIEESGWAEYTGDGYSGRRRRSRWYDDGEEKEEVDDNDADYEIGEVCDSDYYIDQWHAADDTPVDFGQVPIGDGEILPPGALDGEPPDERHFSEATGNEGASFERTYLRAALVLWPVARFDRICASAGPDAALTRLAQLVAAAKEVRKADRPSAEKAVREMARTLPPFDPYDAASPKRVTRLLESLRLFNDAELLIEATSARLLEFYDGSQNQELAACVPLLGAKRAAALFRALALEQEPVQCAALLDLWTTLAGLPEAGQTLLASAIESALGAIARYQPAERPAWRARIRWQNLDLDETEKLDEPMRLTPGTVAAFLGAVHASACVAKMPQVIAAVTSRPLLFLPETMLLPALEMLKGPVRAASDELWTHCARHYLSRSERPPEPPRDWAQNVKLSGNTPLLRELEAFARNPEAQVHRFRVRKELRQEIHRAIEQAGLDMKHVTERSGSPQTLICTKTRASYERACVQHQRDLADMRRLLALPAAHFQDELAQRMQQALK